MLFPFFFHAWINWHSFFLLNRSPPEESYDWSLPKRFNILCNFLLRFAERLLQTSENLWYTPGFFAHKPGVLDRFNIYGLHDRCLLSLISLSIVSFLIKVLSNVILASSFSYSAREWRCFTDHREFTIFTASFICSQVQDHGMLRRFSCFFTSYVQGNHKLS